MLELDEIHTYYGQSHTLQGVSLRVKPGTITALLGRNGAGKTTVINSIIGFNPPRRGKVIFKGQDIVGMPDYQIAQKGVGLVPQGRRIFKRLTVLDNLKLADRNSENFDRNLMDVYSYFPVLRERSKAWGGQLSGGEQQMLAIARVLLSNADLLLMDEPSEGLAPIFVDHIGGIIKKLVEKGLSILLVEQNIALALDLAEYVYIIGNGVIVHESTSEVLSYNDQIMDQYLGVYD